MAEIARIEIVSKEDKIFRVCFKSKKRKSIELYYRYTDKAFDMGCEKQCILWNVCDSEKQVSLVSGDLENFCCVRLQYMKEIDDILKELGRPADGLGGFYIAEIKRR